jgi:sugar lactone lactonase YvrE
MRIGLLPTWLNAAPRQRALSLSILGCVFAAGGTTLSAQIISADNLTPFQPRDVGTTSDAKTVRIKLNYARAISSIAVAPGNTEFASGAVSGCVVDGHTINPALSACSVDVTFSPKYSGLRTAPLVMTDGAGTKSSVGLEGVGLAPRAALTPGIITTVAGNGTAGFSGDGGPATEAMLRNPYYLAFDHEGNLYISDTGNSRVRKVDHNGIITTVAGNGEGGGFNGIGGPATSASFGSPYGLALDAAGNIYIAAQLLGFSGNCFPSVLKVDLNGIITEFANFAALSCDLLGLGVDAAGNLYIPDPDYNRVSKYSDTQGTSFVAGNGTIGFSGDGGPATQAQLDTPADVSVDTAGNFYIADMNNNRIRKVDTNGIITTIAGNGSRGLSGDGGPATQAELAVPSGVAVDAAGNVYIADSGNARIRRIDKTGTIRTIAGTGNPQYSGDGGGATQAGIDPVSIAIDSSGALYLPDYVNNRVRKVDVSQSAINFASHVVGTTSPSQQVTVTNTGNQHVELTDLTLTGDFGQLTGTARDCTDTTFLGAGFSCALRITFAPTAVGSLTGSATVTDNSLSLPETKQTITLSGTGTNH